MDRGPVRANAESGGSTAALGSCWNGPDDLSGFQQFEVQSFGGHTGTYQIKVRVNNICVVSDGKAMYRYGGGPDGYLWDVRSDSSTRDKLRPHPLPNNINQNVSVQTLLGDNEDWYWESVPDVDWYKIEGLKEEDHEYTFDVWTMDELPAKHQATRLKILGILDSNGIEVPGTSSSGSGKQVRVTFQPQNEGTFYISVGSEAPDRTGVYRIRVSSTNLVEKLQPGDQVGPPGPAGQCVVECAGRPVRRTDHPRQRQVRRTEHPESWTSPGHRRRPRRRDADRGHFGYL